MKVTLKNEQVVFNIQTCGLFKMQLELRQYRTTKFVSHLFGQGRGVGVTSLDIEWHFNGYSLPPHVVGVSRSNTETLQ